MWNPNHRAGRRPSLERSVRLALAIVALETLPAACAFGISEHPIDPAVPPSEASGPRLGSTPVHERSVVAPADEVMLASAVALVRLGFTLAEVNGPKQQIVTHFQSLSGNTSDERRRGIGLLTSEQDVYSAGEVRLIVQLTAHEAGLTRVRVLAELLARTREGEPRQSPAQRQSPAGEGSATSEGFWKGIGSNGALEDGFLAALAAMLYGGRAAPALLEL